jgi:hypothetical protein
MTPRRTTLTAAAAAVLLTAGCGASSNPGGGSGGPTRTGPASSAAAPVPSTTTSASAAVSTPAAVPSPDNSQQAALLTALFGVQKDLALDTDQAVTYARNVCQYVVNGDTAGAQSYAVTRAAADGITITDAQGVAVVSAVQSTFCQ